MKKTYLIIIVLVIVIIAMAIVFGIYIKNNTENVENIKKSAENIEEQISTKNNTKNNTEIATFSPETIYENTLDETFNGYTSKQWQDMIDQFYGNYKGIQLSEIICKYDKDGNYTATIATQYEVCGEFVFDSKTSFAKEKYTGVTIDFINGKIITEIKNKSEIYTDNICLAIGYVPGINSENFVKKYFESDQIYNSITSYDFREEIERQSQYENKFIFIPKNENVKISIYDCNINNDGKVVKNNLLIENVSEPFTLMYDIAESTTPQMCVKLQVNGFEDIIPLVFSGKDGHLDLEGHESEVRDISIY